MNTYLHLIYVILQLVVLVALGLPTLYLIFFAVAGKFYRRPVVTNETAFRKMAVLIPAYREDGVIVDVAKDALLQDYPVEQFEVVIIADSLQPQTITRLKDLPVTVIEVMFDKSTKSKALNRAMQQLEDNYDIAVILDADNLMARDFLKKINGSFRGGFLAVQGHRTARNLDTSLAVLDAISEEINNHIFRKGHRATGLSSAIIGSGMAFGYRYFRGMMSGINAVGGFDKEIELTMLKEGHKIEYADDAYVYDEKVSQSGAFTNQRRRWLSAQFLYFRRDFWSSVKALIRDGNIDYFDKTLQFILPPRILLLGLVLLSWTVFSVINLSIPGELFFNWLWFALGAMCVLTFILSVPLSFYSFRTMKALGSIPKGMSLMLKSLLTMKGANRQFLHTEHHSTGTKLFIVPLTKQNKNEDRD